MRWQNCTRLGKTVERGGKSANAPRQSTDYDCRIEPKKPGYGGEPRPGQHCGIGEYSLARTFHTDNWNLQGCRSYFARTGGQAAAWRNS
jgi:hypothetical protein